MKTANPRRTLGLTATSSIKRVLYRAQTGLCTICGQQMHMKYLSNTDHTIPLSLDGPDVLGNMTCTHNMCNSIKGNRMPTGCELIWLIAVNSRLGVKPDRW